MMFDRKHFTLTASVLVFAAFIWWFSNLLRLPDQPVLSRTSIVPDYFIDGMQVVGIGHDGEKNYVLRAKRLTHYPKEKLSRLEHPYLIQYESDGSTIHTRARKAYLLDHHGELTMKGNVRIIRKMKKRVISEIQSNVTHIILPR